MAIRERVTHLSLHVPSLSVATVYDLPLWAWRQYVDWQDAHIEAHKKPGVSRCVRC